MANHPAKIRQADVTRALKGAQAAGLHVVEFFASAEGVRVVTSSQSKKIGSSEWDEVLPNDK